eukprot:12069065-Karenia_brevis.AAC.1
MSNGRLLNEGLWRANRLVDAYAKKAATEQGVQQGAVETAEAAKAAAWHAAALLGTVTHASNHVRTEEIGEDGMSKTVVRRDSAPRPRCSQNGRRLRDAVMHAAKDVRVTAGPSNSGWWQDGHRAAAGQGAKRKCSSHPPSQTWQRAAKRKRCAEMAEDEAETRFWVEWAPTPSRPRPVELPTAAERLESLRLRVRRKQKQ